MMLTYLQPKTVPEKIKAASNARSSRLYTTHGVMSKDYLDIMRAGSRRSSAMVTQHALEHDISIIIVQDKITQEWIAASLCERCTHLHTMYHARSVTDENALFVKLFVHQDYRRKSIATNMVEMWRKKNCDLYSAQGEYASIPFFNKHGIHVIDYWALA